MITELAYKNKPKSKRKKHTTIAKKEWLSAYLFLLPAAVFFFRVCYITYDWWISY